MTSWAELRSLARAELGAGGIVTADADARWMVEHVSRDDVTEAAPRVREMVARRLGGEPLQYVLGEWSFYGLDVLVDDRVLAPRPETEITASIAIEEVDGAGACVVADLGTGSGVIALALAHTLPAVEVWATDLSEDALRVAEANVSQAALLAARVRFAQGNWFAALPAELRGRLRLVVSNPPYVSEAEHPDLPKEVRDHEPRQALVAGSTGTEAIEAIVGQAPAWLGSPGSLVVELAPHQAERAVARARAAGFDEVEVRPDLSERDRVLVARRRG